MSHPTPTPHTPVRARRSHAERRRSFWLMVILLLIWSICLGIGMAHATEPHAPELTPHSETIAQASPAPASTAEPTEPTANTPAAIGTVDIIPAQFQAGQKIYLENCATCHIAIPPAVLPSQTWQQLIQDPEHYGATIRPLQSPEIQVLWRYLREYSRPLAAGEPTPYRIQRSQIFRALHPRVTLPDKVTLSSCASCHPGAGAYDFRRLSSEWQNAP